MSRFNKRSASLIINCWYLDITYVYFFFNDLYWAWYYLKEKCISQRLNQIFRLIRNFNIGIIGEPSPKVIWKKGNKKLKQKKDNGITIENADSECVLSISDCTKDNEGTYTIEATNPAGTTTAEVKVYSARRNRR